MTDNIEKFNERLNESVSGDDYYNRWTDYRTDVTMFATEGMWSNSDSVILGAGNLNDIDLSVLCKASPNITLADIDRNAVLKAIKRQTIAGNLNVIKVDLGGLDENSIFTIIQKHINDNDEPGLKKYLNEYKFTDDMKTHNFDNVLVSAVYTQLFIPQFMQLLSMAEDNVKEKMLESALAFTGRFISHINDTILQLAADDATICVWSDVLEYENGDPALSDIMSHIEEKKWMDSMYEIYIRDYGHGLGTYGIYDLTQRLNRAEEKWLIWPFNENRTLVVKIVRGVVTS